jgi:transcriptional regulator with XRE-family HTH domain
MSEFGKMLKELRTKKEISQRKLAEMVGIDFTYISKIESGAMDPPAEEKIVKMADVLGEDPDAMIIAAKKIPSHFQKTITENKDMAMFLRKANNLSQGQWDNIRRIVDTDTKE